MGLYASATLVWGIPIEAFDPDTGEPTMFWDAENDDWAEFEGELYVIPWGSYQWDQYFGILTTSRINQLSASETAKEVVGDALNVSDKAVSKSEDQARSQNLPVSFYESARWWLVAYYG